MTLDPMALHRAASALELLKRARAEFIARTNAQRLAHAQLILAQEELLSAYAALGIPQPQPAIRFAAEELMESTHDLEA